jgi:GntR family transcriptional regulator
MSPLRAEVRYVVLADVLRREVAALAPNTVLPTEQQLTKRFGVSRVTVRRALGLLERSGLVSRQRGRGTSVSPPKVVRTLSPVLTIDEDLRQQGAKAETQFLRFDRSTSPPDFVRARLALPTGASVGVLALLRLVDDRIIAYDERYLPPAIAERFDPVAIQTGPVSEIVQELAGARVTGLDWEIEIVPCSSEIAPYLRLTPGVLVVCSTASEYLDDGRPILLTVMSYRIDRVKLRYSGHYVVDPPGG